MFVQTDEHPVVKINWHQATKLCEWRGKVTGKKWGLPTHSEWDAAVGKTEHHWGDYYPPSGTMVISRSSQTEARIANR
jgi:formylglycine-generating enzyme required for sulfatase activity